MNYIQDKPLASEGYFMDSTPMKLCNVDDSAAAVGS